VKTNNNYEQKKKWLLIVLKVSFLANDLVL